MADYSPIYQPGDVITSTTSGAVTGGQVLYVSGSGTVAATAGASSIPVGVAGCDAASGAYVPFYGRGVVHRLTASGTVTAGDTVEAAAAGAVATHTIGTNDARIFGVALTTATTGNAVEIMEV